MEKNKILFIEDHADLAYLGARFLQSAGHMVTVVRTGKDGLAHIENNSPDVIILDLSLPDMGVDEIILTYGRYATANRTPIVLLSGMSGLEALANFINTKLYLQKPYSRDQLITMVQVAIGQRQKDSC